MVIAITLFAFSTVMGWSYYGARVVEYLFGVIWAKVYRIFFVVLMIFGAILESSIAWDISDTFNGMMMLPNLIGVMALSPLVMKLTKNYVDRRIKGKTDVKPMLSAFPEIQAEQEAALTDIDDQ